MEIDGSWLLPGDFSGEAICSSIADADLNCGGQFVGSPPSSLPAAILALVGLIYEAGIDSTRWQALIDAYVKAVGGSRGCLVLNAGRRDRMAVVRCSSWSDEHARLYADRYVADDLYSSAGLGRPEGAVRAIDLTCRANALQQSMACRNLDELLGIRYEFSGVFFRSTDTASMIVAVRGEREGPFNEPAFAILQTLIPHLRRATLLQSDLSSLRAQLAALTIHLDRYPYPFLLTDARGRVLYANWAATETASLKDGLSISSGQLSFMSPKDQVVFVKTLEQVVEDAGTSLYRLEVKRRSHNLPYILLLIPVPRSKLLPPGFAQSAVSVLIIDREARPELDPAILRELFSLTRTEARLTAKLGGGRSAQEISEEMGISLETVRTHIRRILSKTATARQGELISLVLRTAPFRNL